MAAPELSALFTLQGDVTCFLGDAICQGKTVDI